MGGLTSLSGLYLGLVVVVDGYSSFSTSFSLGCAGI
jgi:hypothetical protein